MAETLTIALRGGQPGPVPGDNGRITEHVTVTGDSSASGDTGVYTCQFVKQPDTVEGGPFTYAISGRVVTLTDEAGIGDGVAGVAISGYA